ncbi:TPA: hypothetical protein DEG21_03890 [Patescibacteria group bacterium]|nr:hypothetical protein [Candidatus Gracilibacteria bacterium]HBY74992.1 hypothetical protein [Candidatus Gracilibacteria bacterium]
MSHNIFSSPIKDIKELIQFSLCSKLSKPSFQNAFSYHFITLHLVFQIPLILEGFLLFIEEI